jgi:hypothetical protein
LSGGAARGVRAPAAGHAQGGAGHQHRGDEHHRGRRGVRGGRRARQAAQPRHGARHHRHAHAVRTSRPRPSSRVKQRSHDTARDITVMRTQFVRLAPAPPLRRPPCAQGSSATFEAEPRQQRDWFSKSLWDGPALLLSTGAAGNPSRNPEPEAVGKLFVVPAGALPLPVSDRLFAYIGP